MKEENSKKKIISKIIDLGISEREALELIKVSEDIESDLLKLKDGYPIQYLIGYVDFYGIKINVDNRVLIPRYETEELCDKLIKYCDDFFDKKINVLDMCCGSGCIGITLYKNMNCNVVCSDISKDALDVAKKNSLDNESKIKFVQSDLFENITDNFDVIVSNPPYISYNEEVSTIVNENEPHLALYAEDNGLSFYNRIISQARMFINEKFVIAFEIGYTQGEDIIKIVCEYFSESKVVVEKDMSGKDRFVFIFSE